MGSEGGLYARLCSGPAPAGGAAEMRLSSTRSSTESTAAPNHPRMPSPERSPGTAHIFLACSVSRSAATAGSGRSSHDRPSERPHVCGVAERREPAVKDPRLELVKLVQVRRHDAVGDADAERRARTPPALMKRRQQLLHTCERRAVGVRIQELFERTGRSRAFDSARASRATTAEAPL